MKIWINIFEGDVKAQNTEPEGAGWVVFRKVPKRALNHRVIMRKPTHTPNGWAFQIGRAQHRGGTPAARMVELGWEPIYLGAKPPNHLIQKLLQMYGDRKGEK